MTQPRPRDVAAVPQGLALRWSDGATATLVAVWLRDSCRCEVCGDTTTGRRFVTLADREARPRIAAAALEGDGLAVTWADGHDSRYDAAWLRRHGRPALAWTPRLWDAAAPPDLAPVDAGAARDGGRGTLGVLRLLRDQGVALLAGVGPSPEETEATVAALGTIQVTSYGKLYDNVNEGEVRRLSNSSSALMAHTDEPFRYTPPGIIAFHCVTAATEGGASTLIDGFRLAEEIARRDPEAFRILSTRPQSYERRIDGSFDLVCHARAIALDGHGRVCGFRFAERSASPPHLPPGETEAFYDARRLLAGLVADPAFTVTRRLGEGEMLLFDNHRIMHGRTAISGPRLLRQCSVAREDAHSTLRMIARRLGEPDADLDPPMGALA